MAKISRIRPSRKSKPDSSKPAGDPNELLDLKYKLGPAEQRDGGLARGAAWRKKRDNQINARVLRFAELSTLTDLRWRPALGSLARVTLLLERSYQLLKERPTLLNEDGELCSSIDVFRRLVYSQAGLLKSLGLMPTALMSESPDQEINAALVRIEAMKRASDVEPT